MSQSFPEELVYPSLPRRSRGGLTHTMVARGTALWDLAGFMVVISVACAYVLPTATVESSVIMEQAVKESATNPLNAPAGFAAPTTETPAEAPATTEEAPKAE